jgi:hypothetical protein
MSNSPSIPYLISLHHQLLTASAHLRHRSRMQCNAGVCKTAQLHFRIHLAVDQCMLSVRVTKGPCTAPPDPNAGIAPSPSSLAPVGSNLAEFNMTQLSSHRDQRRSWSVPTVLRGAAHEMRRPSPSDVRTFVKPTHCVRRITDRQCKVPGS